MLGYMAVGASVGGVVLPIAAQNLIPRVGYIKFTLLVNLDFDGVIRFKWTMRIIGFILTAVLGVSNLVCWHNSERYYQQH